jgi:hypothetical protein
MSLGTFQIVECVRTSAKNNAKVGILELKHED